MNTRTEHIPLNDGISNEKSNDLNCFKKVLEEQTLKLTRIKTHKTKSQVFYALTPGTDQSMNTRGSFFSSSMPYISARAALHREKHLEVRKGSEVLRAERGEGCDEVIITCFEEEEGGSDSSVARMSGILL